MKQAEAKVKSIKKEDAFEEAEIQIEYERLIDDIERYEIARSGWVIWLNYLGLKGDSTVDEAMKIMVDLQNKSTVAREGIAKYIKLGKS